MTEITTLLIILYSILMLGLLVLMVLYVIKGYKKHRVLQKRQDFKLIQGEKIDENIRGRHQRSND